MMLRAARVFLASAVLFGCGGPGLPPGASPVDTLAHAERKMADEDYLDAIEILEGFIRTSPGASLVPQAKMRLGDARFELEDFTLARAEYEDVVQDYPTSPYVEEARWKIARCEYSSIHAYDRDPTETEQTVQLVEAFLRDYPNSTFAPDAKKALDDCRDRLARREYETGRFYERRGRPRSALIQFQFVVSHYPETVWSRKSLLRLGEIHLSRKEKDQAIESFQKLIDGAPGTEEARLAETALAELGQGGAVP
jgi:outer membrane protein assembly factor BamD